jgi:flavin-dependent dehydrogenase
VFRKTIIQRYDENGRDMSKTPLKPDVLVLGQHPCAYLAAAVLLSKPGVAVVHASIPSEHAPDRLVIINPELFALHKPLEKLKKKLALTGVWGLNFVSADPGTRGEFRAKSVVAYVGCYAELRKVLAEIAKQAGARLMAGNELSIERVHEKGFDVIIDGEVVRPQALLLAGALPDPAARQLALPEPFPVDVMRRYSFLRLKGDPCPALGPKPTIPMSLDLDGLLIWAWLLPGEDEAQFAVEQPLDSVGPKPPKELMRLWGEVLKRHGLLRANATLPLEQIESMDIPAAGALARESVANRTLLFGPAGGFYTACLEDVYPNCWSALFAADAVRKALKEPHLQDALQPYRHKWGTTLGDYLRGPQQNLRFLLPLVYRNPVMTTRLGESILLGKSVVR